MVPPWELVPYADCILCIGVAVLSSKSAVLEILRAARLAPTTIPCSKSFKSPFFPVLMLGFNFSKLSSPHLDA